MVLSPGDKVHVIIRRNFENDLRQHVTGVVEEATEVAARVTGYLWVFERSSGEFSRRNKERTRVISLVDAGLIINVLPATVHLDTLRFATDSARKRILTDGHGFENNISEFDAAR